MEFIGNAYSIKTSGYITYVLLHEAFCLQVAVGYIHKVWNFRRWYIHLAYYDNWFQGTLYISSFKLWGGGLVM